MYGEGWCWVFGGDFADVACWVKLTQERGEYGLLLLGTISNHNNIFGGSSAAHLSCGFVALRPAVPLVCVFFYCFELCCVITHQDMLPSVFFQGILMWKSIDAHWCHAGFLGWIGNGGWSSLSSERQLFAELFASLLTVIRWLNLPTATTKSTSNFGDGWRMGVREQSQLILDSEELHPQISSTESGSIKSEWIEIKMYCFFVDKVDKINKEYELIKIVVRLYKDTL